MYVYRIPRFHRIRASALTDRAVTPTISVLTTAATRELPMVAAPGGAVGSRFTRCAVDAVKSPRYPSPDSDSPFEPGLAATTHARSLHGRTRPRTLCVAAYTATERVVLLVAFSGSQNYAVPTDPPPSSFLQSHQTAVRYAPSVVIVHRRGIPRTRKQRGAREPSLTGFDCLCSGAR